MSRNFSKYYLKIFVYGLLLGCVPILVLGSFFYVKTQDIMEGNIIEGKAHTLTQARLRVEQKLVAVENISNQFIVSQLTNTVIKQELTADKYNLINDLIVSMNRLHVYDIGVYYVELVNQKYNWVMKDGTVSTYDDHQSVQDYEQLLSRSERTFWTLTAHAKSRFIYPANQHDENVTYGASIVKKLPFPYPEPYGAFIVTIPLFELNDLANQEIGTNFIILNNDNVVLAHPDQKRLGSVWDDKEGTDRLQAFQSTTIEKGNYIINGSDEKRGIALERSDYNGWTYISTFSIAEVTKESQQITRMIAWFVILLTVTILLLSLMGSRSIYHPLRKILNMMGSGSPPNKKLDSGDEFEWIADRMRSLIVNEDQMEKQIRENVFHLKEWFVLKLLWGEISPQEMESRLEQFGFPREQKWLAVLCAEIDTFKETKYKENDHDLLLFAVNNISEELIPAHKRLSPIVIGNAQFTVVYSDEKDRDVFVDSLHHMAENLQEAVHNYLGLTVSVGISRPYRKMEDTTTGYAEALDALKYRMQLGYNAIIFIDDVRSEKYPVLPFPSEMIRELIRAIKLTDRQEAKRLLHEFVNIVLDKSLHPSQAHLAFVQLLMELIWIMQESDQSFDALYVNEHSLLEQLQQLKTAEEIENWFAQTLLEPILQTLLDERQGQHRKISEQMLQMIHEKYDSDLNLDMCASQMNYHSNYLKRVFRMETGQNFRDYLMEYRLHISKKLLLETDMSITKIAEKLKYNNASNFIRYFSKMVGVTPGKYRKTHSSDTKLEYGNEGRR